MGLGVAIAVVIVILNPCRLTNTRAVFKFEYHGLSMNFTMSIDVAVYIASMLIAERRLVQHMLNQTERRVMALEEAGHRYRAKVVRKWRTKVGQRMCDIALRAILNLRVVTPGLCFDILLLRRFMICDSKLHLAILRKERSIHRMIRNKRA